ncbi:MAG: hypothetical protein II992_12935 [Lachnospiraceae bacterium]|nr:hypothetical protein [Lachnospiraceae bacterium]
MANINNQLFQFTQFMDYGLEIVLFFDEEGKVTEGNQTAKNELGYGEEINEISICRIFPNVLKYKEEALSFSDLEIEKSVVQGDKIETVAYRKNQTCFSVDLKVVIKKENGSFFGMCLALNTATQVGAIKDMVKAKEKVEDATKIRNEFVSNVTHELRTPVNGILGISKNLLDTNLDEQQKESIHIIHMCCSNMIQIINNLLDFSKLEAGKFSIEEREFSFREAIDKIISMNINQVNEKGLKLLLNISPEIPERIIGDELRISQILTNLINNAVKFTSVGQIVVDVVKTIELNHTVELFFMVMDTGIGIASEDMDKLFKSFSQVDASITRRFGGSGLGLTIVKQLVELMDGEIHVESEKGKGSTFSFSIRVKKADIGIEETQAYKSGKFVYDGNTRREIVDLQDEICDLEEIYCFGTAENKKEIKNTMEKLILCIEMENWEKAELFSGTVKKLVESDKDLKRKAFRLEMTIRKEDYENAITQYKELKEALASLLV